MDKINNNISNFPRGTRIYIEVDTAIAFPQG